MGGKTKRHQQAIYLDPDKAELLDGLSEATRVPKQEYLREAVDMVLKKYHWERKPSADGKRNIHIPIKKSKS